MSNLVRVNWRGGIFSSRFQYIHRVGSVRKGEQIYRRGAWVYLCVFDSFYREAVKRRTERSSLAALTADIGNLHCFSICGMGGQAARGEKVRVLGGRER